MTDPAPTTPAQSTGHPNAGKIRAILDAMEKGLLIYMDTEDKAPGVVQDDYYEALAELVQPKIFHTPLIICPPAVSPVRPTHAAADASQAKAPRLLWLACVSLEAGLPPIGQADRPA